MRVSNTPFPRPLGTCFHGNRQTSQSSTTEQAPFLVEVLPSQCSRLHSLSVLPIIAKESGTTWERGTRYRTRCIKPDVASLSTVAASNYHQGASNIWFQSSFHWALDENAKSEITPTVSALDKALIGSQTVNSLKTIQRSSKQRSWSPANETRPQSRYCARD